MDSSSGAGSSAPPLPRLVVGFRNGAIVENKKEFQKKTRELLYNQIGLSVSQWAEVPDEVRKQLWATLKRDFEIDDIHYGYVMKMMGNQLRTFRNTIRKDHLRDLDVDDIKKLRNNPPEGIPLAAWDKFIDREATEMKMAERMQNAENRSQYNDEHCMGSVSYEETRQRLDAAGVDSDRTSLYSIARTRRDGTVRAQAVKNVQTLNDIAATQDPVDKLNVDTDAVAKVFGRDKRGRTRCVSSRISKIKYMGSKMGLCKKAAVDVDNSQLSTRLDQLVGRVERMERGGMSTSSSTCAPASQFSPTIPLSTPPARHLNEVLFTPSPSNLYTIMGHIDFLPTAIGHAPINQREGDNVKLSVVTVFPGREQVELYKPLPGASVFGQLVQGNFIEWPGILLKAI